MKSGMYKNQLAGNEVESMLPKFNMLRLLSVFSF